MKQTARCCLISTLLEYLNCRCLSHLLDSRRKMLVLGSSLGLSPPVSRNRSTCLTCYLLLTLISDLHKMNSLDPKPDLFRFERNSLTEILEITIGRHSQASQTVLSYPVQMLQCLDLGSPTKICQHG